MQLVIVSGRSGSGKTTALHVLEDMGYYCVDNLPLTLLPELADTLKNRSGGAVTHLAIGVDARNVPGDLESFRNVLDEMTLRDVTSGSTVTIYLDARDDVLLARFSATRRRHPLSSKSCSLQEAIELEKNLLDPVSAAATLRIDTSSLNVHELREQLRHRLEGHADTGLTVLFESFAFKQGVPLDADLVFDVRCLPNPHWHASLRAKTGRDNEVHEFLNGDALVESLYMDIAGFLLKWLPEFRENDRSYVTVAIGCTGGQHRSVYMVERLSARFREEFPHVQVRHRDLPAQDDRAHTTNRTQEQ
ncbi:MAG TPA: RNase adapter RapZ [Moraxellaceae bacterium]|nr:RNase adapter RapZ [Moraxellaceae bacterium]